MGTCYTYLLYDDFDWGYRNKSKEETFQDLKKDLPVAEILAQWSHYVVVDLDKNSPYGDNVQKLRPYCDSAYFYGDTSEYELHKVEFKKPPKHDDPTSIMCPPSKRMDRRAYYKKLLNDTPTRQSTT